MYRELGVSGDLFCGCGGSCPRFLSVLGGGERRTGTFARGATCGVTGKCATGIGQCFGRQEVCCSRGNEGYRRRGCIRHRIRRCFPPGPAVGVF